MRIISFSGVDGSGKSTFSERAAKALKLAGVRSRRVEVYRNSIYLSIGRLLGRVSAPLKDSVYKRTTGPKSSSSILSGVLRKVFLLLDIAIFRIRLTYYNLRNITAVCDRYFYDMLAHYLYLGVINEKELGFFLRLIPRPDMPFLLMVNGKTAFEREKAHSDIKYFEDKNKIYGELDKKLDLIEINSSRPELETWADIKSAMGRKRILMVSRAIEPPWNEASKNLVRDIVSSTDGYDFYVLTAGSGKGPAGKNIIPVNAYTSPDLTMWQKARLLFFLLRRRSDFDLHHFCFTPEYITSFFIKRFIKKGRSVHSVPYLSDRISKGRLPDVISSGAITVNSEHTKKTLIDNGISNIVRVYPGVDTGRFDPAAGRKTAFGKLQIPKGFIVLWAGDLASDATVYGIADIIVETCRARNGIYFVAATRIKEKSYAQRQKMLGKAIKDAGLEGHLVVINSVEHMADLMACCDVMIYPLSKGFKKKIDIPYVLVEAMASGKPVVVSDVEPLNEVIACGGGITASENNAEGFVKAVVSLFDDEKLRRETGARNRETALKYFDRAKNIAEFAKLYDSILKC